MAESTKLLQILELLLAEGEADVAKAEEMLHEYVVAKARAEYEKVLEAEDDEFGGEEIDQSNDFEADIADDEGEIDADEEGEEDDFGGEEDEEGEEGEDLEDKVEDLEAELEALRAEFDALMADEADEPEHADMDFADDMDSMDDMGMDDDIVQEATNFSNKVAAPKPGQDDNPKGFTAPKKHFKMDGQAVPHIKDGSEGDHGKLKAKDYTPADNLDVEPKKV